MTAHHLDRAIDRLARRQAGAFSHTQTARIGMTQDMADDRVATGRWVRIAPAVFVLPGSPGTFLRQCWAAVLAERTAAVGGFAAAAILQLPDIRPGRVELVVPPGSNARNPLATVHRYADPLLTHHRGLPVTTVAQTIIDIAGRCSYARMERVMDGALLDRRTTIDLLDERLARYEGTRRAGLPLYRAMLLDRRAEGWMPTESELERKLDRVLHHLPGEGPPVRQQPFPWRDPAPGRVDRWLPRSRVIVEGDGRRWHARFRDFDRDRWRDNIAAAHGILVLRFTWVHLIERAREARELVIATARRAA